MKQDDDCCEDCPYIDIINNEDDPTIFCPYIVDWQDRFMFS